MHFIFYASFKLVVQMNSQLATHVHGPTPIPSNANQFTADDANAARLKQELNSITTP